MIEPSLGISIPDHLAVPLKHRRGREGGVSVLVVGQTYDNVQAQQYLAEICRLAGDQAGVRLLALEGADGAVDGPGDPRSGGGAPPSRRPDAADLRAAVADLIRSGSQLSAGVVALDRSEPARFELWGVDDPERIGRSQAAMSRVIGNAAARDRAFGSIRDLLALAENRCYGARLAALRLGTMPFSERMPLGDQVAAIAGEALRLGLDLAPFPSVLQFADLRERERRIRTGRVERQRATFVTRVAKGLFGWFRPKGHGVITIDPEKLQPVLEFWWEKTGRTRSDHDRAVAARGLEAALLELKSWLETWLAAEAKKAATTGASPAFFEELMRLALRLEVPYFDLLDFRESVAMTRSVESLKRNLVDEISSAIRELALRSGSDGGRLWNLEERLSWLFRALSLEVPANEAEVADLTVGRLTEIVEAIAREGGSAPADELRASLAALEQTLESAGIFLRLSWERGRRMAERTLERLEELGEDRALLVAGGFHTRAITQTLEERDDVSWSVVAPSPDLGELAGRRRLIA